MRKNFVGIFLFFFIINQSYAKTNVSLKNPPPAITVNDPLKAVSNYMQNKVNRIAGVDTIHILALRAEFVQDNVATTTGDGRFDLSSQSDYAFDRPPHNRTYFQQQLLALANYFSRVSRGKLIFQADVFPQEEDAAYQLPQDMVYYSGQENDDLKKQRWAELLRDAVNAADVENGPDFSAYDVVIVFHAGVGADFAFDFDSTPYDIQSVFLDFESLKETLGRGDDHFKGVSTKNKTFIKEGILLPETQNQDGLDLALLGTMTLLMGSQLGMPVLFDSESGDAGIGKWGLMDQGSYNFQGLVPAQPCAWMKIYMGWEEPVVVTNAEQLRIGIANSVSPHIYKIPINANEYFLVENRQQDWNGDNMTFGRDAAGKRAQFDSTGQVVADKDIGVITRVDEYDYGLPGSGILIWHIDDSVIREKLASNTINNDRDHRGIDLVECDGAQDIGFNYSMFDAGYGTDSGDYWDPYWAGNESHKIVNDHAENVELSSKTIPNSNANNGAVSHVRLYNFSARDTVMTFSVGSDWTQDGFPRYAGKDFGAASLLSFHDANNSGNGLIAVRRDGAVLGWKENGEKLIANDAKVAVQNATGDTIVYDLALFATADDSVFLPPIAADFDGNGTDEIVAVDKTGKIYLWSVQDANGNGSADLLASINLGAAPTAGPMILPKTAAASPVIILGTSDGNIHSFSFSNGHLNENNFRNLKGGGIAGLAGVSDQFADCIAVTDQGDVFALDMDLNIIWQINFGQSTARLFPMVADFDGVPGQEVVVISQNGMMLAIDGQGNVIAENNMNFDLPEMSAPALGDADGDGLPEILLNASGLFGAFEYTGVPVSNFTKPYASLVLNPPSLASPLWMKNEAGQKAITFVAAPSGLFNAYDVRARMFDGFPLTTSAEIVATPLFTDVDSDGDVDLFVISTDGFLYGWDLPLEAANSNSWSQYGGDQYKTFALSGSSQRIVSAAGLLPAKKVFCYPNPTENNRTHIRYTLTKTADKLGVRIYDMAGEFVQELPAGQVTAGDHEIVWNVANIESGVYLARVEAESGSENSVEFIKIAVVK